MPDWNPDEFLKRTSTATPPSPSQGATPGAWNPDEFLKRTSASGVQAEAPKPDVPYFQPPDYVTTPLKHAAGFATGVAEVMNPLAVPHSLEVIGRATQEDANPNASFFGRIGERLQKAEASSVTPKLDIDQIAAGIRTVGQLPFSDKPISEIYKSEVKNQKDYEENFLPKGSKAAGELTATALNAGLLVKDVAGAIGAGTKASEVANQSAFNALKPKGVYADKVIDQGRAQDIGQQLLDDKIVTSGASWKDILSRTKAKLKDYGEQIGYYSKAADKAAEQDSSIAKLSVDGLASKITKEVVEPRLSDASTVDEGNAVANWVTNLKATNPEGVIGFERAQQLKTSLGKKLAKFNKAGDSTSAEAFQDVYHVLNEAHEEGISAALSKAAPEMLNGFEPAKDAYRNLSDANRFISKTVASQAKNRGMSPTDYLTGAALTIAGSTAHGSIGPKEILLGLTAAAGNHLGRTRGNQVAASFFNSVNESLKAPGLADPIAAGVGVINSAPQVFEFDPIEIRRQDKK